MIKDIWRLIMKYKSLIAYAFFGVCTTVINVIIYSVCARLFGFSTVLSTGTAWVIAVLFAYITNRKWVFESQERTAKGLLREITYFFGCRLLTGLLDVVIMYLFVDVLALNDLIIKVISNILVIIINYAASKILIFKKKKQN